MKRLHLAELHDLKWFPKILREYLTDFLSFFSYHVNPYKPLIEKLNNALKCSGNARILDLCSGDGRYMLRFLKSIKNNNKKLIILSDKFPDIESFKMVAKLSSGRISYIEKSTDAVYLTSEQKGFRTFFSSFHHFKPDDAQKIIANTINSGSGIAIFEYTDRNILTAFIASIGGIFLIFFLTPLICPFKWTRLLWTYLIPVIPIIFFWDSFISHLRTYTVKELKEFVSKSGNKYHWEISTVRSIYGFCKVTYLIGYPVSTNF